MALFAGGALLGVVGIARRGEGWWVLSGIVFLALAMVLSVLEGVRRRRAAEEEDAGGTGGGEDDDVREPHP